MAYTELALSTATFPDGTASYSGGAIVPATGTFHYFHIPSIEFDPAKSYQIQVDYAGATSTSVIEGYSQLTPDLAGYNNSQWGSLLLAGSGTFSPASGQRTFTVGVNHMDWNPYVWHGAEHFLIWEWRGTMSITGMRWQEIPGAALPPDAVGGSDLWTGAGLLYFGEAGVDTPQGPLTWGADEPPIPGPEAWQGAGTEHTAWWKLQPLDEPTWISVGGAFTYTGHLEVFWKSSSGWVEKMSTAKQHFDFKANAGQNYYVRVTAKAADPTSDLSAALDITTPRNLRWQDDQFNIGPYTTPMGATMATAPTIVLGSNTAGVQVGRSGARETAYECERQERNQAPPYQGWYKFIADKTGIVQLNAQSSGFKSLALWTADPQLVGSRWNSGSGSANLLADVQEGVEYFIRIAGSTTTTHLTTYKIAAVAHGYAPMTSVVKAADSATSTTALDSEKATLTITGTNGSDTGGASLLVFNLGGIPIPAGSGDGTGALGYMADVRFIQETQTNLAPSAMYNDSLSFSWFIPGSNLFYWPMDNIWESDVRREHYISLTNAAGSINASEANVVAGTLMGSGGVPGQGFLLDRWLFRQPGTVHTVYLTGTRLRASWFVDDAVLDDEPVVVAEGDLVRSDRRFVDRS